LSASYEQGPRWFVPGYDAAHTMAAFLLRQRVPDRGCILVIGAGGGVELSLLAAECDSWTFVGVDPSQEMIDRARRKVEAVGAASRVSLVQGYVEDAPRGRFDAATAFLCLNFIPDDGRRLDALREVRSRLVRGGTFLMINGCADMRPPHFDEHLKLYAAFGQRNGAPADVVAGAVQMQRDSLFYVRPDREEELLSQAGFTDIRVFYCGMWIYGWIARV